MFLQGTSTARVVAFLVFVVWSFSSARICFGEEQKLSPGLLLHDTEHIFTAPAHWNRKNWTIFSIAAAGIAGTMAFADKPLFVDIQKNREGNKIDAFSFIEPFGFQYAYGIVGGFYLVGAVFDKPKARLVGRDSFATSLITLGLVEALKFSTGRSRPRRKIGAFDFHPFNGNKSFPSGHAAEAFGLATVITSYYHPLWLKISAYGLAGLVGLSRIDHNQHFISDVVAGASLGTAIGYSITHFNRNNDKTEPKHVVILAPIFHDRSKGISMTIVF